MMLPYTPEAPMKAAHNCPICTNALEWRPIQPALYLSGLAGKWWCPHCRAFRNPKK